MQFRHPKYGEPVATWPYHDGDGHLVGHVARFDYLDKNGEPAKEYLPITYCDIGNGRRAWRSKGFPEPRPLYRLPDIAARPDAPVIVAEGEKAADAAAILFPYMVATTPPHGAKSPHKADWSVVGGRTVIIATDHDEAGQQFGDEVCELVRAAGAVEALHLPPDRLGSWVWRDGERVQRDGEIPQGWDIADALAEGWTAGSVAEMRDDPAFMPPYRDAGEREEPARQRDEQKVWRAATGAKKEWPFRLTAYGVEKRIERADAETGAIATEWKWFCSPLEVLAETRSGEGEEWGRLLGIIDRDGTRKEWAMPMAMLAGDGRDYRAHLLSLGIILAPGVFANRALHEYISTARPEQKARCVSRLGWNERGNAFVLPRHTTGGDPGERVIYQSDGAADDPYRTGGDLAGWQDNLARFAVGNSRLAFALSAAFAGPLLFPAEAESGGFHFRGGSSIGKTTALQVAGSVWGGRDFPRTWRATSNGLESVALMHCDTLLLLDEISQCSSREAGETAYMLANGQGKTRASRSGGARRSARWRTLFLSTGEISLSDKIAEDGRGRRAAAGQEVRIVDIPADAGAGMGLFENLHGFASADAFSRHLRAASGVHYGYGATVFLEAITRDFAGIAPLVSSYQKGFVVEHCPPDADGQVSRVVARFGLVAAAGELATALGVLPWEPGEAQKAAGKCFHDWLDVRGGVEPAEEREAVAAVRRFIELHGNARFEPMGNLVPTDGMGQPIDMRIPNRAGFRRRDDNGGIEYLVLPEAWRGEVCAGLDAGMVARTLLARGMLAAGGDGKPQKKMRIPGFPKSPRCYVITSDILGDDAPEAGDA